MSSVVTKFGRREREEERDDGDGVALPYIVDNYLSLDGGEMRETLNMGNKQINNLQDPTNPQDAATKNYVDSAGGHTFFTRNRDGDYVAGQALKMNGQKIEGLPLPINDGDATTKIYTDTAVNRIKQINERNNPFLVQNQEYTAKEKLNMRGFKIENVGDGVNPEDVATLKNVSDLIPFEKKNGGFLATDHIHLNKKKLGGVRDPVKDQEAANKKYVDEKIEEVKENVVNKFSDGVNYQIDANVNLQNYRLYGVPDPQREDEIANKKYVDEKIINGGGAGAGAGAGGAGVQPDEIDNLRQELVRSQAFTTRNAKTYDAKGNINMKGKKIRNVEDATEKNGVITKGHVDDMREYFEQKIADLENIDPNAGAAGVGGNGAEFGDMKGKKKFLI